MKAYDVVLGTYEIAVAAHRVGPPPRPAGWAGPAGPAIDPATWPRSPRTGQPLVHDATIALPPEYRYRSPNLVAMAVFDWPDESGFLPAPANFAAALAGDLSYVAHPDDPFWGDVAAARPHPHGSVVCDPDTGSFYGAVWLTAAEFTGPRTERPRQGRQLAPAEDLPPSDERVRFGRFGDLWLVERDNDPNAGRAPGQADYVDVRLLDDDDADFIDVDERFSHVHFGGTLMDPNGLGRRDISAWYMEIHRLGGLWVGDDENLVLDLATDQVFSFR
ncbi:hypothetical protein ACFQFC_18190 [Amorphoplanes digitatis]|uniref:Uncharacterized protein n=1 Tax=Actinoplanes digitatis TaxID=1868 RepID=A0A7W7MTU0_9ACTN|nr:hypothetical protein [Actinoplanes digitatis]MBB4766145.1 hypothetical protein [Actinoplanes digitatis]GID96571.1 hypothetical protein Adi01nite_59830 [Actinoplanes digitatis]